MSKLPIITAAVVVVTTLGWSSAGTAQDTGYRAISQGDLRAAEQRLESQRLRYPDMPELMLNLAAVYLKTGRTAQATLLYRNVLAAPPVNMDMPSGAVTSSHAIAQRGLALMRTTFATQP